MAIKNSFLFLLILMPGLTGATLAQGGRRHSVSYAEDAHVYLGLRAGFIRLEDVDEEGSFNLGLSLGYLVNRYWSLEGSVDFQESELEFGNDDYYVSIPLFEQETVALQFGMSLFPVPDGLVRPYLEGGVGYYFSEFVYDEHFYGKERIDDGGYYAGLGFEAFGRTTKSRGFTLVTNIRWLFTQENEYPRERVRSDGYTVTLGFKYKF